MEKITEICIFCKNFSDLLNNYDQFFLADHGNQKSKLAPKQHEIERIRDMIKFFFESQEINFPKYFSWGKI